MDERLTLLLRPDIALLLRKDQGDGLIPVG